MNTSDQGFRVPDDQPPRGPNPGPFAGQAGEAGGYVGGGAYVLNQSERNVAIAMQLLMLASLFVIPVVPGLVIWLATRQQSIFVDWQGKEALNAQLSWFVYTLITSVATVVIAVLTVGVGICVMLPVLLALYVLPVIFCVMGAMAASDGRAYQYPMIFRVLS